MLVEFDKLFWVGTVEVIAGTSLFRICKVNSEQNLAILSQTISSKLFKKQTVIRAIQRCREIINIIPWISSQSLNFHHFCTKSNSFVNHSLVEGILVFWENCIKAWRYYLIYNPQILLLVLKIYWQDGCFFMTDWSFLFANGKSNFFCSDWKVEQFNEVLELYQIQLYAKSALPLINLI